MSGGLAGRGVARGREAERVSRSVGRSRLRAGACSNKAISETERLQIVKVMYRTVMCCATAASAAEHARGHWGSADSGPRAGVARASLMGRLGRGRGASWRSTEVGSSGGLDTTVVATPRPSVCLRVRHRGVSRGSADHRAVGEYEGPAGKRGK